VVSCSDDDFDDDSRKETDHRYYDGDYVYSRKNHGDDHCCDAVDDDEKRKLEKWMKESPNACPS
jgi:hypothetical protein